MATKYVPLINDTVIDRIKSLTVEKNLTQYSGKFNMVVSDPSNTVYDAVTSGDEIRVISRLSQGLSAYYKLDETWGDLALDATSNYNDGTIVNGTKTSVKYSSGLAFTGTGYVSIANPITDWSEWAVSLWSELTDVSSQETSVNQTFINLYEDANNGLSIQNVREPLVAHYPFNGDATDAVGSNDGVVTGASLTTDRFGTADSAYDFNVLDTDKIVIDNLETTFTQLGSYTVSCWVKQDATGTNMNVWNFAGSGSNRHNLNFDSTSIGFQRYDGGDYTGIRVSSATDVGEWMHIVCVNNAGTLTLYKDGSSVGSSGNNYAATINDDNFYIGYPDVATNGTQSFDGTIDDVRIYDTVLTATDVTALYTNSDLSGKIKINVKEAGTDYSVITDSPVLTDSTLSNILVTYETNTPLVYVDGVLVLTSTTTGTVGATNLISAYSTTTGRMTGKIDNIRIYERFVYAGEALNIYDWEAPFDLIFGGYCEKIERDKDSKYTLYIKGGDYTTRLNDIIVLAQIYNEREYSVIIRDLLNKYVIDANIIFNCDVVTDWSETGATLTLETGDDADDNSICRLGDGCLKLVPTATTIALEKTASGTKTFLATDYITMYIYVEDATEVASFSLDIGQDSSNYYNIAQCTVGSSALTDGWNYVEFDMRYKTTGAGTPALAGVDYYNINITLDTTTNVIYIDDIRQTPHAAGDITLSSIEITEYYTDIKFKNVSVFDSIRKICDIRPNTFDFYIDISKILNFGTFGTIDSGQTLQRGVNVLKSEFWDDDTNLYNKVTVYGAKQEFNKTETFDGDTTTKEFVLSFEPITQTVSIGGVEKEGYVQGMSPTEYDYRVDKSNRTIIFTTAPGTGTDNISVTYTYGVPIIVQRQNDESITNYKLRETKIENEFLLTKAIVTTVAQDFVDTWKDPILNAKYSIRVNPFFDIGENVAVIDEKYFLDSVARNFMVVSLKHNLIGGRSGTELSLTQITKSLEIYLQELFTRLNALEEKDKGDADVLARLLDPNDDFEFSDDPENNLSVTTKEVTSDVLIWGHPTQGIWGTNKWGDTLVTAFILGLENSNLLGFTPLGSEVAAWSANLVTNPSD